MAYTPNIPAAGDIPAQSQPLMQDNCNQIATALAVDHGPFNAGTEGQHVKISFTGAGTVPATPFGIYATAAAMLLRNNGTNIDITTKAFNTATNGYCYLPCGLLIKFGRSTTNAGGHLAVPINLNAIGVNYNAVPFVFVSGTVDGVGNSIVVCVRTLTSAALNVNTRTTTGVHVDAPFQWMAIGTY